MLRMAVKGPGAMCHVARRARSVPLAAGVGARGIATPAQLPSTGRTPLRKFLHTAAIAQLGERQTEDQKVPGSIPGLGMLHAAQCCA